MLIHWIVIPFYLTPITSCDAIHKINHDPLDDKTHFPSSYRSTVLLSMHSPSASTSLIISWSSASVGFCPRDLITVPNSFVVIVPSPSLSNRENASLNSAKGNHTFWCLWGLLTACESNFFPKHFLLSMSFLNKTKEAKKNVQYQYYVQAANILVTTQPILAATKPSNSFFQVFLTTVSCISWNLASIAWKPLWLLIFETFM